MQATKDNIKLLNENESDMKRQDRLAIQITELEKQLKRYKANLNVMNNRVKVNAHKIVQSYREMVRLRQHQQTFSKTCHQVGLMVAGPDYRWEDFRKRIILFYILRFASVPELSCEIEKNYSEIAAKTESIIGLSADQHVKNSMKIIAERVRGFIPTPILVEEKPETVTSIDTKTEAAAMSDQICAKSSSKTNEGSSSSAAQEEDDSEVLRMIKEDEAKPVADEPPVEMKFPEIQKQTKAVLDGAAGVKRAQLGQTEEQNVEKKLRYESPLEFLRLPKNKYGLRRTLQFL